jgi:hypothetical protein
VVAGDIHETDLIICQGMREWVPADCVPGLLLKPSSGDWSVPPLPSKVARIGPPPLPRPGIGAIAAGLAGVALGHAMANAQASGSTEATAGTNGFLVDLDDDGDADAIVLDLDNDGRVDAVAVDVDDDGQIDAVGLDTDGDGDFDVVGVDVDSDGDIDEVFADLDDDGDLDDLDFDF